MALKCTEVNEWVEEEVSQPIEEWEERQEERCKQRKWYDPRSWVCWLVTLSVKVVRWVLVKVGKWVVRTVCRIISVLLQLVEDILRGLWDIIAGIFTLDWRRIADGFILIFAGVVKAVLGLLPVVVLGDTIVYITEEINRNRLRQHVRKLLEEKYTGDTLANIKAAIRLDRGAFGLRLQATAYRTILDSETPVPESYETPPGRFNLEWLHEMGHINLRELCGFEFTEGFWRRPRYTTSRKDAAFGGVDEIGNPISKQELDQYISSQGKSEPPFIVLPMSDAVLDTKLETASDKGRQLGLIIHWTRHLVPVVYSSDIAHSGSTQAQDKFLETVIGRTPKKVNLAEATSQLCNPIAVGIFKYLIGLEGLASNLNKSNCGLRESETSGVTFIDNKPDHVWKYVPIHELGHYFGLCHANGLDRIMVAVGAEDSSWLSWSFLPNFFLLRGEPYFTLAEAKAAWDYIVAHFDCTCLSAAQDEIPSAGTHPDRRRKVSPRILQ